MASNRNTTWLPAHLIDYVSLKAAVKPECEKCNLREIKISDRCDGCLFTTSSKSVGDKKREEQGLPPVKIRFGVTTEMVNYGFPAGPKLSNYGKHQVHMFLHYPDLGGCGYPRMPQFDLMRQINSNTVDIAMAIDYTKFKQLRWDVHHINRHYWDDSKENLCLCLNSEHKTIEDMTNLIERNKMLNAIAKRNLILFGVTACPTFRI